MDLDPAQDRRDPDTAWFSTFDDLCDDHKAWTEMHEQVASGRWDEAKEVLDRVVVIRPVRRNIAPIGIYLNADQLEMSDGVNQGLWIQWARRPTGFSSRYL